MATTDSIFKKTCPICNEGWLLCVRDPGTMRIRKFDNCTWCAQVVEYVDYETIEYPSLEPGSPVARDERQAIIEKMILELNP